MDDCRLQELRVDVNRRKSYFCKMHKCAVNNELKLSAWCKTSRRERQEQARCSVCRVIFCCSQDRERHEDAEHGRANAKTARQQRQIRKESKPLVCLICGQVFTCGLFVNESCNKVAQRDGPKAAGKLAHALIIIPEWAVSKYLIPNSSRKRSWEAINGGLAKVKIQGNVENLGEYGNPVQENSFISQKTSIQSILSKQRKTELSVKRERRVTFSPITAVAITSVESINKVETRKTLGEPSPDSQTGNGLALPITTSDPLPCSTGSEGNPSEHNADTPFKFFPLVPKDTPCKVTFLPFEEHGGKEACVFSPPLPSEGTNGSPLMAPQMSSTPVCDHSFERRTASSLSSPSEYQTTSEASGPSTGIFGSLANIICCAFQALPSVLTQFFATVNESENTDHSKKERSSGRERRQRRRSATFTPYVPVSIKKRRLHRKKVDGQDPSPILTVNLLRSHPQLN